MAAGIPCARAGSSGVWELFVPGLGPGEVYKYEVKGPKDYLSLKADPYAFQSELRPRTASVALIAGYEWGDGEWMEGRAQRQTLESPVSIYEVHLASGGVGKTTACSATANWPNNWCPTRSRWGLLISNSCP